jgi:uncharacterized membrane protein (DUF373 family)
MPIVTSSEFVAWFRSVAPYINAFRGHTFVIAFGGEVVADGKFVELTHDFNLLASLDDVLQCVAGFLLAGVAVVLLYHSALVFGEMFSPTQYQDAVLRAIHDILLVMIVLELLWTVLAYLREHTVPLEPFLFVGIISSVRKLLLIGAQMSIEHQTPQVVDLQLREMLVHGGLIFVLIVGLVLVRW